jgi:hypothetical protein
MLLTYLIVIRPGLVELAHIRYGAHASMLYCQFLWVTSDELVDSDSLSTLLESMTGTYCCVGLKLQPSLRSRVA